MKRLILSLFAICLLSGSALAQYQSYRIQKDETLESLAEKFKVSKAAILKLNPDLTRGRITNKVIIIPPHEVTENTPNDNTVRFKEYKVKPKETLYSLSKRNHISIEELKKYNPYLYKEELGAGDLIRIPTFSNGFPDFNASVQTSSFRNLIHVVMPKETKYGISKQYGMSVAELDSLNPLVKVIHPGQVLKVLNQTVKKPEDENLFDYYQVQPKETYYSLTHRLGISKDSLIALNPILKELGLQAGMELKIPKNNKNIGNIPSFSAKTINLTQHLTNFSTKRVAVLLPFSLQHFAIDSVNKKQVLKKDPFLQISLDLYSGIKLAIDSVQKLGISVDAQVFDTQKSKAKIRSIIADNNLNRNDFIIGPVLSSNIALVAEDLRHSDVALFSPLTNGDIEGSDKVFQTRPTKMVEEKVMISYLDSLQAGKNLLILSDSKHAYFAGKFRSIFPQARVVSREEEEYLQNSDYTKHLSKTQPNWIVIASDDYGDVTNSITYLNALRDSYDIRVFTTDKNSIYDEVPNIFLSHLNFTYTSVSKSGVDKESDNFTKRYKAEYGITPSAYAIRGFDITYDALLRSASASDLFRSLDKIQGTTEYVGNRFNYQKKLINGYFNNAVFLIKYDKELKLTILN